MSDRRARRLAWATFGFALLLIAGGFVLALATPDYPPAEDVGGLAGALFILMMFSFAVVGLLVLNRQPRNTIAWILMPSG